MNIENLLIPTLIGGFFGVACLGLWFAFRHWLPLWTGIVVLFLTVVIVVFSWVIDSPREEIERTVQRLATTAQNNDVEGVLQFVSKSAGPIREAAKLELGATHFISCWIAKVHSITIDDSKTPPQARIEFAAIVHVEASRHGPGRGRVQIWLELQKESDRQWRIVNYGYTVE